jgi:hypothetical protein
MPPVVLTVVATVVAVALLTSTLLFVLEVFFRRRDMPGQVLGLFLSLCCDVVFVIVYSDRLPGRPTGLRDVLANLPGTTTVTFASSAVGLVALVVVYVFRAWIYCRLFVIPAMRMSDHDYYSQEQVEQRANDFTAPVLAFVAFAVCVSSGLSGAYALPGWVGVLIWIGLIALYFGTRYLQALRRYLRSAGIYLRIALRNVQIFASRFIIAVIVAIGRAERWRTSQPGNDQVFEARLRRRLDDVVRRAQDANARERGTLRRLVLERKS